MNEDTSCREDYCEDIKAYRLAIRKLLEQISKRNQRLASLRSEMESLKVSHEQKTAQTHDLEVSLQAKDARIVELGNSLQARIVDIKNILQAKDSQIEQLNSALQAKDSQMMQLKTKLYQIEHGIVMQIRHRYQKAVEKLLCPGTKRHYYYDLVLKGIRIILNEGWSSFFTKVKRRRHFKRAADRTVTLNLPKFESSISIREAEKIRLPKSSKKPEVSIIIPAHNKWQYTLNCLRSISEHTDGDYEVIVVDDASNDETVEVLSKISNLCRLRNEQNVGFIESCNRGVKASKSNYVLFLNNDTMVTKGWLAPLLEIMVRNDVGAAGSKLVYPNGTLQEAGGIIWSDGSGWNYGRGDNSDKPEYNFVREVDYCSGSCLLVKRDLFERIGGFDRRFKPGYYEDSDLCFSFRNLGYKVMYQPMSVVIHYEGVTGGTEVSSGTKKYQEINRPKFLEKWRVVLQQYHYGPKPEGVFRARSRLPGENILVIDHHVPTYDQDSGSLRMFEILKILVELRNNVTFIGADLLGVEPYTQALQQKGIEVLYAPHVYSVEEYLKELGKHFDVVIISRSHIAIKYMGIIKTCCPNSRIIYDTVDLQFLRESRRAIVESNQKVQQLAEKLKSLDLYLCKHCDVTLVVSPVEKAILLKESPSSSVEVLSNIHQVTKPKNQFEQRNDILFVGGFGHPPNIDAAVYFVREIFPLVRRRILNLNFFIVGSNPTKQVMELKSKDVIVTGYVNDLRPYFENRRVFVAPLRYGAGVKGKINQSMSYGLPVVTTSIGAEGMGLVNGVDALIADEPEEFAEKVVTLYRDEELWNELSRNSIENVQKNYSPEVAREKLKNVFKILNAQDILKQTRLD